MAAEPTVVQEPVAANDPAEVLANLRESAREANGDVVRVVEEIETYIEKGTPAFMRTSLALFSGASPPSPCSTACSR